MQQQVPGIPHNKLSHPFSMLQHEAAEAKAHVRSLCQTHGGMAQCYHQNLNSSLYLAPRHWADTILLLLAIQFLALGSEKFSGFTP